MNQSNKLFLIDGMALIYRSYYALQRNPLISSSGLNTSSIYGFINTLLKTCTKIHHSNHVNNLDK